MSDFSFLMPVLTVLSYVPFASIGSQPFEKIFADSRQLVGLFVEQILQCSNRLHYCITSLPFAMSKSHHAVATI